jgi:hypothetical protein
VTTGLPAKRMRSTGNSRGATFSTATPPAVAYASSAPTISPAMRQRVLALLPTPRDRAAGLYAPQELTTIMLASSQTATSHSVPPTTPPASDAWSRRFSWSNAVSRSSPTVVFFASSYRSTCGGRSCRHRRSVGRSAADSRL